MTLAFLAPSRPHRFAEPDPLDESDALHDAVSSEETEMRRAFLAAVLVMLRVLDDGDTSDGISPALISAMLRAFEQALTDRGQPAMERALLIGARFAWDRLPVSATVGYTFDLVNPEAVLWAQLRAATFVTGVSDETRRAIRALIARALSDGIAPRDVAKQIRPLIGLTERDALAVGNLQTRLIEEGRSARAIERLVTRYANRLLRLRAETIARTEIMAAANSGQVALWDNSVRDGLLIAGEWDKAWLTAHDERTCPRCGPLDGVRTAFPNGTFPGADGRPPLHPRCRCAVVARRKVG